MSGRAALVVSIHDVAPGTLAATRLMLAELERAGIDRCSLLVVPNYHGGQPVSEFPGFIEAMRGFERDGHEIVLHGYYHLRQRRAGESLRERAVTSVYTAGEGEFYDLGYH